MPFEVRRVVTGHDASAVAVILQDEVLHSEERLPGYHGMTVWCTAQLPVDNNNAVYTNGAPGPKGTRALLRIAEMSPGETSTQHLHRTETLDYAVVLSGECAMIMDGGEVVNLHEGDVVVQRGTSHGWIATGDRPARMLFVLIDALPVQVGDRRLGDFLENYGGRLAPMPAGEAT
jgi:quercetin dioxygenase-like cupin family protein